MKKLIKYGVAATLLAGAGVASATSLPGFADSGVLQSGASATASCQTSKLDIAYTPDGLANYLYSVTVSNIDPACQGKYLTVSTIGPDGSEIGQNTGQVPAGNTAVTYTNWPNEYIHTYNGQGRQVDHVLVTFSDNAPHHS